MQAATDRAILRRSRVKTEYVKDLPDVGELKERAITGQQSYFLLASQKRIVMRPGCLKLLDGVIETPSAVARDYLQWQYGGSPWARKSQIDAVQFDLPPNPAYARPCVFNHGWYIDIKSAYWSIMQMVGWDVDYWPKKWLGRGVPPFNYPFPDDKRARTCLVSCAIGTAVKAYNPHALKPFQDPFAPLQVPNPNHNLQLWRLVRDVLMCIAFDAVAAGAVYANTDGYIAVTEDSKNAIQQIIADWGLESRIKATGRGRVVTHGIYDVGREKHSIPDQLPGPHTCNLYRITYKKWLQDRFSFWASVAGEVV